MIEINTFHKIYPEIYDFCAFFMVFTSKLKGLCVYRNIVNFDYRKWLLCSLFTMTQ